MYSHVPVPFLNFSARGVGTRLTHAYTHRHMYIQHCTVDLKNSNLAINMMLKKAILEQKKNATLSDFRILVAATREVAHAALATLTLIC